MGVRGSMLSRIFRADYYHGVKRLKDSSPLTPRGYIPVCVGVNNEMRRFMVHTTSFGDADFLELLWRSAEEYGFCNQGILKIPLDAKDFEERVMRGGQKMLRVRPMES